MKVPRFNITTGKYKDLKFHENEIKLLIKSLEFYQSSHPQNSWAQDLINHLQKEKFKEVSF